MSNQTESHKTEWYVENRIILTTFVDDLEMDELEVIDGQILERVQAGQAPVHHLIDVRQINKFPTNIGRIRNSARRYLMHDNMGWMVVIGFDNPIIRFLSSVVSQMTAINMIQVDDVDEAIARLKQIDMTLKQ